MCDAGLIPQRRLSSLQFEAASAQREVDRYKSMVCEVLRGSGNGVVGLRYENKGVVELSFRDVVLEFVRGVVGDAKE